MGLTLDTGALIALERRKLRARTLVATALRAGKVLVVPAPVLAEWWRARTPETKRVLDVLMIETIDESLACLAGEALAQVGPGPSAIDAIVMASAAQRGDTVLTSDIKHLTRLQVAFPDVRVLSV